MAPSLIKWKSVGALGIQNHIEVSWSKFSPDASIFNNPGCLIDITNQAQPNATIIRPIAYQNIEGDPSLTLNTSSIIGRNPGVLYEFNVRTCSNFESTSRSCADSEISDTGYAFARVNAGSPRAGIAQINWTRFSINTLKYRLERCNESTSSSCEFIEVQNATSFEDQNVSSLYGLRL